MYKLLLTDRALKNLNQLSDETSNFTRSIVIKLQVLQLS